MTNPGFMRDVIRIEQRSTAQDGSGEESPIWSLVATRLAEKLMTPGREIWSAKERHARIPTVFRIRSPDSFSVGPQMRIVHKSKVYNISSVIEDNGHNGYSLLTCEELVGEPSE